LKELKYAARQYYAHTDQNNFDQLRFLAASLVILSHSYPLALGGSYTGEPLVLLTGGHETFGHLSVATFFVISGYLITQSWSNQPKLMNFAWKRILRIYPGIMATILFTLFLIGPLVSSLNLKEYLFDINLLNVLKNIMVLRLDNLPGVFENNIYPTTVNGSLWTLPIEAEMYIMTAVFGLSGVLKKKWPVLILSILLIIVYNLNIFPSIPFEIIKNMPADRVNLFIFYLSGMCYYLYKDKIKYDYKLFLILLFVWFISFHTELFTFISIIPFISIPYIILCCAFVPTKYLQRIKEKGDYSYGLYIYAFPIQQMIVHFSKNTINPIELFIIAYPATLFMAFLSWNYIEKRALKYKNGIYFGTNDNVVSTPKSSN
jgi:peptidoglycan/LPS O-acetylase OafA/YrhL